MAMLKNQVFRNLVIISMGVVLIALSAYNIYEQMRLESSPLDVVDAPAAELPGSPSTPTQARMDPTEKAQEVIAADNSIVSGISVDDSADSLTLPTPDGNGYEPDRIVVDKIGLDAPIIPVSVKEIEFEGKTYQQWLAPNAFEVGWHNTSAFLGVPGNTVLNGHHNVYGEVFGNLVKVREGDIIKLYSGDREFVYKVALVMLLPEKYKSVEDRMENARWILPTDDERITMITCWPKTSNTHRVVVVALPYDDSQP